MHLPRYLQIRPRAQQPAAQRLCQCRQSSGALNAQWRVADANLDRSEFRLGPHVPVQVLDAGRDAAGLQHAEIADELRPVGEWRALPAERKGRDGVETGRLEKGIDTVNEWRRRRESDEYRHVHAERLRQPDRIVGRSAADVDVLAEDSELLGEVAVALVQRVKALAAADAPFRPAVEGMRATATDGNVVARTMDPQDLAQAREIGGDSSCACPWQGADFDHALGNLQLDVAEASVVVEAGQQVSRATGQVKVAQGQQLQFQFDAQRQRFAVPEFPQTLAHPIPPLPVSLPAVSPDLRSAMRHSAGPASSMRAAAKSDRASAERPISGYRPAIS
ncbi:MAG: hypothetical protein AW07_04804 [Candidatus Accumulibacter sp. SK-11]|nr:MAG: hypothetical protein AW07_04804 [Candidatus Accumulibacter sp. SK-11]